MFAFALDDSYALHVALLVLPLLRFVRFAGRGAGARARAGVILVVTVRDDVVVTNGFLGGRVLLSALLKFADSSFVGQSPGGGKFLGVAEDGLLRSDEVLLAIEDSAKSTDAVSVDRANLELNAVSVVDELEVVLGCDQLDLSVLENVNLEDGPAALVVVFVDLVVVNLNPLAVDENSSLDLALNWADFEKDVVVFSENDLEFLVLFLVLANQEGNLVQVVVASVGVQPGVGHKHDVPDASEVDGVSLVVESLGFAPVDGAVSCNIFFHIEVSLRNLKWIISRLLKTDLGIADEEQPIRFS